MGEQKYFKRALSNLTFDVASGDAVRHLADRGYTVRQIRRMLDFPTPEDYVQKVVWEHFLKNGVLRWQPEKDETERYVYVTEYNAYGHKSFRRVCLAEEAAPAVFRKERPYREAEDGEFSAFLKAVCDRDGEREVYVSCDFGLRSRREPERYEEFLGLLDPEQQDYIRGLPWERRMVYHRLDGRMRGIVSRLYRDGGYSGSIYRLKAGEKILF